jgi:hypothetical protein
MELEVQSGGTLIFSLDYIIVQRLYCDIYICNQCTLIRFTLSIILPHPSVSPSILVGFIVLFSCMYTKYVHPIYLLYSPFPLPLIQTPKQDMFYLPAKSKGILYLYFIQGT